MSDNRIVKKASVFTLNNEDISFFKNTMSLQSVSNHGPSQITFSLLYMNHDFLGMIVELFHIGIFTLLNTELSFS